MSDKKQFYSDDELVIRLWDKENVRDTMSRFCYYLTNNERRRILNELFVQRFDNRKTASIGVNNGYYVGWESISNWFVVKYEERQYEALQSYVDAGIAEKSSLDLGLGQMHTFTANTTLVEVADDGMTAQYLALNCGNLSIGHGDGKADDYITNGSYCADLIKEGDEWKIWKLKFQHDATTSVAFSGHVAEIRPPQPKDAEDVHMNIEPPKAPPEVYIGPDPVAELFGEPDVPVVSYMPKYGWTFLPEQMPWPYEYYDSRKGFGPEGQHEYVLR